MKRDEPFLGEIASPLNGTEPSHGWREACGPIAFALIWILALYGATALQIVAVWSRSETFTHGFIVPLIVGWLIWRDRAQILQIQARPNVGWLAAIATLGLAWLASQLAVVDVVAQFSLTGLLVLSFCAIVGNQAARRLAFPLGFLFFAVPIGEFLLPTLMQWTADFTVGALRLSGIPVYREGQEFVIPSGRWSVVEACSGIRYLIASLMIGTLYAYLTYHSLQRRLMFVGAAIVIPIVANWVRAYMIVMLGHLSNNKIAVGVDHLIYGWLFFGVVMLLMFWVGSRWRDDDPNDTKRAVLSLPGVSPPAKAAVFWQVAAAIAFITAIWPLALHVIQRQEMAGTPALALPLDAAGWHAVPERWSSWEPRLVNPSTVARANYRNGGRDVGVYIGYYRDQAQGKKLVSSENVLVTTANRAWIKVDEGTRKVEMSGQTFPANFEELRGTRDQRVIAVRMYWVDGHLSSSDYLAKLYTLLSRLRGSGDDGAIVIAYAPKSEGQADSIDMFLHDFGPALSAALERTRNSR